MSSLLSGMEEQRPARPVIESSPPQAYGRKRKSSPDYLGAQASSDGFELGSDESYLGRDQWSLRPGASAAASSSRLGGPLGDKRSRLDKGKGRAGPSDGTRVKVEEDAVKVEDMDADVGMDMQGSPDWPDDIDLPAEDGMGEEDDVKPTIDTPMFDMDDDDDDLAVKPTHKPSAMGPPAKRKYVNATSTSLKNLRPTPAAPSFATPAPPKPAVADDGKLARPAWESLQDSLLLASDSMAGSDDLPPSSPPPSSASSRARSSGTSKDAPASTELDVYESDGTTLRMYWLDFLEQEVKVDESVIKNLYLFGKVFDKRGKGAWRSVCLKIDGLERNLFVVPREKTHSQFPPFRHLASFFHFGPRADRT